MPDVQFKLRRTWCTRALSVNLWVLAAPCKAILTEGPLAEVFPSFRFECHADYFPLSTSTVHWQLSFEKDGVISLKGPEEASLSAKDIWSAELLLMYFSDKSKCWLFLTGLNVISVLFSDHIKKKNSGMCIWAQI